MTTEHQTGHEITQETVKRFIKGTERHSSYHQTKDIADHLSFHIDGYRPSIDRHHDLNHQLDRIANPHRHHHHDDENPYFLFLIDDRRPRESIKIKNYRRRIWSDKTKQTPSRVISSLNKIVRAEDWKIDYSKSDKPKIIKEEEQLEIYAEKNYPFFGSVENWAYNMGLRKILSDPNALIVVMPVNFEVKNNEHFRPFGFFVPSRDVLEISEHLIIYKSKITGTFHNGKKEVKTPVYFLLNESEIWKSQQINVKGDFSLDLIHTHDFGIIPAYKTGGIPKDIIDNIPIFESFLDPMLPSLDEAAREYSDLQAEIVQHIHSTMWGVAGQDCHTCNGLGKIQKDGKQVACGDCKGEGVMPMSPYKNITLKVPKLDDDKIPIPPVGYVEKQIEIAKLQNERVKEHLLNALESLNMEFLAKTPLNESGKAKEVDKEELNNFIFSVAKHLVENSIRPLYAWIVKWRYSTILPSKEKRVKMLPMIVVPEMFNLVSEDALVEQIRKARDADVDPTIIDELMVDFINKKFRHDPMLRDKLKCINDLNPFSSRTPEEVADLEMSRLITKKDAIIYSYINFFVEQALIEDEKFLDLDFKKKKEIIDKMAEEKLKDVTPAVRESPPPVIEPPRPE